MEPDLEPALRTKVCVPLISVLAVAFALAACGDDDAAPAPADAGVDAGPTCTLGLFDPALHDVDV